AGVTAGGEVDGEGELAVGAHVPAEAVELVVADAGEGEAFPGEACGFPEKAGGGDGGDRVEAGEKEKVVFGSRQHLGDGAEWDMERALGSEGVGKVGVAAGDGAGVAEAEGAGGEEGAAGCAADVREHGAAREGVFFTGDLLGPGELARGCDEWRRGEDLGRPGCGESEMGLG